MKLSKVIERSIKKKKIHTEIRTEKTEGRKVDFPTKPQKDLYSYYWIVHKVVYIIKTVDIYEHRKKHSKEFCIIKDQGYTEEEIIERYS